MMKVGILTYHRAVNYGAHLQSCALCNRLNQEKGITAEIIDFHMLKEQKKYSYNWSLILRIRHPLKYRFLKLREQAIKSAVEGPLMIKSKDYCLSDSVEKFIEFVKGKYDAIVVGSDEVWNFNNFRGFPNPYWLIGDIGCRKLSYAASSRQRFSDLSAENRNIIKESLLQFDYIGVRDEITMEEISKLLPDKTVNLCCDPTFVYDFNLTKKSMANLMRGRKGYDEKKLNAVVMSDDQALNKYLFYKLRDKYNMISVASCNAKYINVPDITPIEWIDIINNADIVFTTYFHGTCFGIITKTPFLSFGSNSKSSKIQALLLKNGFESNYIGNTEDFINNDLLDANIQCFMNKEERTEFEKRCNAYTMRCNKEFSDGFLCALKS